MSSNQFYGRDNANPEEDALVGEEDGSDVDVGPEEDSPEDVLKEAVPEYVQEDAKADQAAIVELKVEASIPFDALIGLAGQILRNSDDVHRRILLTFIANNPEDAKREREHIGEEIGNVNSCNMTGRKMFDRKLTHLSSYLKITVGLMRSSSFPKSGAKWYLVGADLRSIHHLIPRIRFPDGSTSPQVGRDQARWYPIHKYTNHMLQRIAFELRMLQLYISQGRCAK